MDEIITRLNEYVQNPYHRAMQWKKESNNKAIGCLPMYCPEEIIHAAGALPVTLFAGDGPITMGDRHIGKNVCHHIRSTYDSLLKGEYDFLDGIAGVHVCDQVRFFMQTWQLDHPFAFFHEICRPYKIDETNRQFLISELNRLVVALEEFTGNRIDDDALRKSIAIYNRSRAMMRQLYQLRREKPGIVSASNMVNIIVSSMLMPREEHNQMLERLLGVIGENKRLPRRGRKIVAIGSLCAIPDRGILDLIEGQGLVIADDDFYAGGRYIFNDISSELNPIEAIADCHKNSVPCTTYNYDDLRGGKTRSHYADYIVDMVKQNEAEGLLVFRISYCDPFDMEYVLLKKRLTEENIPFFPLFYEPGRGVSEAIRTRVAAFAESL